MSRLDNWRQWPWERIRMRALVLGLAPLLLLTMCTALWTLFVLARHELECGRALGPTHTACVARLGLGDYVMGPLVILCMFVGVAAVMLNFRTQSLVALLELSPEREAWLLGLVRHIHLWPTLTLSIVLAAVFIYIT